MSVIYEGIHVKMAMEANPPTAISALSLIFLSSSTQQNNLQMICTIILAFGLS